MCPACNRADRVIDGRWQLGPEIGRAGAVLYRATDLSDGMDVALKLPREDVDPVIWRAEIEAEAAMLSRLTHPAIVRLHAVGTQDGMPILALHYLPGPDLRRDLQSGRIMAPAAAAQLLEGVADALAWLHRQGLVHGDVTPANLVRDENGAPVLVDFATVRPVGLAPSRSAARVLTTAYVAPGQLRGAPADPRDDIYALAVIAYEMIAGRHPFARRCVQPGEVPQPPPGLPPPAWDGLRAALCEEAALRPADARAVPAALRRCESLPLAARISGWPLFGRRARCPV